MRKNLRTAAVFLCLALVLSTRECSAFQRQLTSLKPALPGESHPSPQYCITRLRSMEKSLQKSFSQLESLLQAHDSENEEESSELERLEKRRLGKKEGRRYRSGGGRGFAPGRGANSTTAVMDAPEVASPPSARELEMEKRIQQLEHLVSKQTVDIRRLQDQCKKLTEVSEAFANVVELLRAAGLSTDEIPSLSTDEAEEDDDQDSDDMETYVMSNNVPEKTNGVTQPQTTYEYFDDTEIFGEAPASVTDAADAAGAAILAGLLGGKQRMLVDVRDSELSRDAETLVQFIELAILPVAAGLEGLRSNRNRVKIVFPTVSQLLEYRRTMALAAPEVVALSTLGFDPVEERDNIVVIVAPPPDDEEGLAAMNELLNPSDWKNSIVQPVVVLNHHMVPLSGPAADFDCMYHLRLLSVQYMSGERADEIFQPLEDSKNAEEEEFRAQNVTAEEKDALNDKLLEAAMKHAHEVGVNTGVTRAMVIRAYPKPWHVFVDVSPDTDADFVVADTFPEEPTMEEVNKAIVECLEGSEREDELVAQQMQQALEMKTNMKTDKLDIEGAKQIEDDEDNNDDEDDDEFDEWYDLWNEDSV